MDEGGPLRWRCLFSSLSDRCLRNISHDAHFCTLTLIYPLNFRDEMGLPLPRGRHLSRWNNVVWKASLWCPGLWQALRTVERCSGPWDLPSVPMAHPICSSLGCWNFFHFRGQELPEETLRVSGPVRGDPAPVVSGCGSCNCLGEGHGFFHDIRPRG